MKIINKYFKKNYQALDIFEAGIVLKGAEVKSIRRGDIKLEDAFIQIRDKEAFIINLSIPIYAYSRPDGYDPQKPRKLLLHKRELLKLKTKRESATGLTIIPMSCYNKGPLIKLEIALAKGKGEIEKKIQERKQDRIREIDKEVKEYMKT